MEEAPPRGARDRHLAVVRRPRRRRDRRSPARGRTAGRWWLDRFARRSQNLAAPRHRERAASICLRRISPPWRAARRPRGRHAESVRRHPALRTRRHAGDHGERGVRKGPDLNRSSLPEGFRFRDVDESDATVAASVFEAAESYLRGRAESGAREIDVFWRHANANGRAWLVETSAGKAAAFAILRAQE